MYQSLANNFNIYTNTQIKTDIELCMLTCGRTIPKCFRYVIVLSSYEMAGVCHNMFLIIFKHLLMGWLTNIT